MPALIKPRTPSGTLELLPQDQLRFQRMLDTIRKGFERFGFMPIETPVFEVCDVLLTKSGGETEKQVYFVQSTGSIAQGHKPDMALRFDLTVPLARYVAEHEHELAFPFRRYQMQRVYRGERNQKGRFREFYQCDIDVIGKDKLDLSFDAEVPAVISTIFTELGIGEFVIRLNNRKLLRGLLETIGIEVTRHEAVLHEIDRLGKMTREEVEARLVGEAVGMQADQAKRVLDIMTATSGDAPRTFEALKAFESTNESFLLGRTELESVYAGVLSHGIDPKTVTVDLSIARGLDYYTGTVYETFLVGHEGLGSICSGGRYDNLAEHYTKSKLPGVGISIGATRLFDQLSGLGKLPAAKGITDVLIISMEPTLQNEYGRMAFELRAAGLNVEVYGGFDKLGKQFKYADRIAVPHVVIVGAAEHAAGVVKIKDMTAQQERQVPRAELVRAVSGK